MSLLQHRPTYDRSRVLEAADRAHSRGRAREAIALYRWALAYEPGNAELQARLAPLLARTRQRYDAWQGFASAARGFAAESAFVRAQSVLQEATRCLPRSVEPWLALADLQRERGQEREARRTLMAGRRQLRRRATRPQAIHLLRRFLELEPWNLEVTLDLARQLARGRRRHEALLALDRLADHLLARGRGHELRRVRWAQLRITGELGHVWLWLRALLRPPTLLRS